MLRHFQSWPSLLAALFILGMGIDSAAQTNDPSARQETDYRLINQLPERMVALKKEYHAKADQGVTGVMRDASMRLNDGIKRMLRELINNYYAEKPAAAATLEKYFKELEKLVELESLLDNPTAEHQGTMGSLYFTGTIGNHLEARLVEMVAAISLYDDRFHLEEWKKRWETAVKTDD